MTFTQFVTRHNGKYEDWDGKYGFMCVDLVRFFIDEVLGFPQSSRPAALTAKQIYLNFKENEFFRKIPNTITGVPNKGDIIFWGWYPFVTGWAGHVAIFSGGDTKRFISFDQNYPTGSFCRYYNHDYRGILGWIEPKQQN